MTVPKLRLAGFKGPWSPKRLGETGHILQERTSDFARYPLYSLTIEKGVTKKTERYERGFLVSKTGDIFKIVHPGNFVTNPMNLRFGAVGYSKEKDDVSVSGYYDVFELDDNKCSPFWFNFLKREGMKKRYEDIATGSLIEKKRVHVNDLLNLELPIPELEERKSLGEYLTSLDRLIDAEVLRLENLRKLKSACLEKMFVHDGEERPQLRLEGFKGEWERKTFGECFAFLSNNSFSRNMLIDKGEVVDIHYGDVLVRFDEYLNIVKTRLPALNVGGKRIGDYLQDGDIVFADTAEDTAAGKCCEIADVGDINVVSGLHTIPCRPLKEFGRAYLGYYLNSPAFRDQLLPLMQGTKVIGISKEYLKTVSIVFPQKMAEQVAIGQYFLGLTDSMKFQINKLSKLRCLKSACMERMFV